MAAAPVPERPVLRRLGVIKDPDDATRLQNSRARRDTNRDGLDLFAVETESPPRVEQPREALRSEVATRANRDEQPLDALRRELAARANVVAPRSPIVPVILVVLVAATALVGAVWAINRLFDSDASPARTEAPAATTDAPPVTANDAAASASNGATDAGASASKGAAARPTAVATNTARTAQGADAQVQQLSAGNGSENAPAGADATSVITPQPDPFVGRAPAAPASAPAPSPAATAAATLIDQTIYSEQDRDVVPPRTSENLPGPTISSWTTRTNAMEVIVSQTGAVERVRLVTPPQRMPDMPGSGTREGVEVQAGHEGREAGSLSSPADLGGQPVSTRSRICALVDRVTLREAKPDCRGHAAGSRQRENSPESQRRLVCAGGALIHVVRAIAPLCPRPI